LARGATVSVVRWVSTLGDIVVLRGAAAGGSLKTQLIALALKSLQRGAIHARNMIGSLGVRMGHTQFIADQLWPPTPLILRATGGREFSGRKLDFE